MKQVVSNKRVLVTGGAGFIGSNLVESLLNEGNYVVCLDNFSNGKRENLISVRPNPQFRLIEGDIRNYSDCQKAVDGMDYVFHQAALGSVPRSIKDPVSTADVNIGGFVKMLFASKEAGVKRFIYAASSSTYGDHPGLLPIHDNGHSRKLHVHQAAVFSLHDRLPLLAVFALVQPVERREGHAAGEKPRNHPFRLQPSKE